MLDVFLEHLDQHLSRHGVITDVVLRTERSLAEEEGTREVALFFTASETELDKPVATVHLFPLDERKTCELEVEIEFVRKETLDVQQLWRRAQERVAEISLTEKKRYLSPERLAESSVVLDYHFLLELPETQAEEEQFHRTLERFAADLGQLIRL
jgi:hypothetical protein